MSLYEVNLDVLPQAIDLPSGLQPADQAGCPLPARRWKDEASANFHR